jgi:hypothetical protein
VVDSVFSALQLDQVALQGSEASIKLFYLLSAVGASGLLQYGFSEFVVVEGLSVDYFGYTV